MPAPPCRDLGPGGAAGGMAFVRRAAAPPAPCATGGGAPRGPHDYGTGERVRFRQRSVKAVRVWRTPGRR